MQRAAAATGVAREFRDVFDLMGVPAYRAFYENGIFVWKQLYRGAYPPWHAVAATAVGARPGQTRDMYRLNAAKAVSAELAGLVWSEACGLRVSTRGRDDAAESPDPLNAFVGEVLRQNGFSEKLQQLIEQGLALGGAAVKVWAEVPEAGGDAAPRIRLGYCMADQFVPLVWDNARVTEGVFISRRVKDGYYYTRLEWHQRDAGRYVIRNELYRADAQDGVAPGLRQDILGARVPLGEMYPGMEERTEVPLEESLFCYWRTPIANNLDDNSPLGVSVYANALETLRALDVCYDSLVQEFRLGKKRIIVPSRFLRAVVDPGTGALRRYFDPNDEVFVGVADDDAAVGIHDVNMELRVEEHVSALNALLSVLCLQLGFSANTFSFDERGGLKTATEVVSENSKTYKTVRTIQNQLIPALEQLARGIIDVAILYGMRWNGRSVESLAAKGYEVKVSFDDGVTQDRQTNLREGVMLVGAGLLSRFTFLTDGKYGQGLTESEALAELERIRRERVAAEGDGTQGGRERTGEVEEGM